MKLSLKINIFKKTLRWSTLLTAHLKDHLYWCCNDLMAFCINLNAQHVNGMTPSCECTVIWYSRVSLPLAPWWIGTCHFVLAQALLLYTQGKWSFCQAPISYDITDFTTHISFKKSPNFGLLFYPHYQKGKTFAPFRKNRP